MLELFGDWINAGLGLRAESLDLSIGQMAIRAAAVYLFAIGLLRISDKRFLGQNTVFDIILGIMLGSVLSRAITGSSAFFPTLAAGGALVLLHWSLALLTYHLDRRSSLIKGTSQVLIQNGELNQQRLRRNHLSERDLLGSLRLQGGVADIAQVEEVHLERSGDISVISRKPEPHIVKVDVEEGIQTIRIEIR